MDPYGVTYTFTATYKNGKPVESLRKCDREYVQRLIGTAMRHYSKDIRKIIIKPE
jgi:hypothetical protein